jgi:hypothetical protein
MNWRRGLFRVWVALSILFAVTVIVVGYPEVKTAFERAHAAGHPAKFDPSKGVTLMVPVPCSAARGTKGMDYETFSSGPGCWYEMPVFRRLYPEYRDLDDDALADRLYGKVPGSRDIPLPPKPWTVIGKLVAIIMGGPAVLLLVGLSVGWIVRGFRPV